MLKLARIISNTLNPLVIFVLIITALIYYSTGNPVRSIKWFIAAAIFSIAVSGAILFAVKKRKLSNFDVSRKKDRPMVFLGAAIISMVLIVLGVILKVEKNVLIFFGTGLLSIGLYALVTRKIKASIHLGVFVLFISIITFLINLWFGFLYLLVPVLAWARVKEHEHTPSEVIVGSAIGFIISLCLIFLIQ